MHQLPQRLQQAPLLGQLLPMTGFLLERLPPPRVLTVSQPLEFLGQAPERVLVLLACGLNLFFRQSWDRSETRVRG